ncbi:MAG: hypothetical protein FWE84_03070 [Firmicutes bacterium]|nr:hypothetical protein [Bacillota bacterium]
MKFSLESLREKDLKIVEKKKIFFLMPAVVLIVAVIMGAIFGVILKAPLNLGVDFTGGYAVNVSVGTFVNDANYEEYSGKLQTVVKDFKFEYDGAEYGVNFKGIKRLGSGDGTSLRIDYRADGAIPRDRRVAIMEELNKELVSALNDIAGNIAPVSVSKNGNTATVVYTVPVKSLGEFGGVAFKDMLNRAGINVSGDVKVAADADGVFNTAQFTFTGSAEDDEIKTAMTIDRYFAVRAVSGDMISGRVGVDLVYGAISAALIALLLVLGYVFLRFDIPSGLSLVIVLLVDAIMTFALMVIFHIEINLVFIAALVAVLAFSVVNVMVIFDRVREIRKQVLSAGKSDTATDVAGAAIRDSLSRCALVFLSALVMMSLVAIVCAIGGVTGMAGFALPVVFGLISGAFSSIFIAPSLWVVLKRNKLGTLKRKPVRVKEAEKKTAEIN